MIRFIANKMIESKYTSLILAIIGWLLAVLCVVIFLNVNNIVERIVFVILWLFCCGVSDLLYKKYKTR